ncbi:UBC-like protein, partial [Trichodelitschia bisporula]
PERWPTKPPILNIETNIYHPNVDNFTGEIYVRILSPERWRPSKTIANVLYAARRTLTDPDGDNPLNREILGQYWYMLGTFNATARE